ncbi:TPA: 50S ribosomal protein L13 [Candidatus Saccharibacteria bacterium]|nr:50S ribosomal protein L13 [Candidatus Saccharibacteria bacterium]HIO87372.1 50S ribosomal protein L13 [Candidatus Saccharibacteria bacterium]
MTKTPVAKPADVDRKWVVLDAATAPVGRVATKAATLLNGKHKATFTPHVDNGEFVIIINADKAVITGRKAEQSKKYSYSGFPGGLSEKTLGTQLSETPEQVFTDAVYGMLPKNKLRPGRMQRLKVYAGSDHPHEAQQPQKMEIK